MPSVINMVTKKEFKTGGRTAAFAALTLGFSLSLGLVSCSQRDPKIDTSNPAPANALGKPPGSSPLSGKPPGVPIPSAPPGGGSVIPPTIPGRSNIITPTPMPSFGPGGNTPPLVNPSGPGGNKPPLVNPSGPGGNKPPLVNPSGPGGNKPPIVNPSVPDRSATQVAVPMQVDMSSGGPKVKIGLPTDATAVKLQYLGVTGIVEGTTVDVSLSFSSGGKSCSIEKASARAEQQTVNVPCK